MSNLTEYVEKVKSYIGQRNDMSETEIIRYVYLDLGKRLSFDLKFAFGNSKNKNKIYREVVLKDNLNKCMETNVIICKSMAYILEYILKELGINVKAIVAIGDERRLQHMYNIVKQKDGKEYIIDLQNDLENIQSHSTTKSFGIAIDPNEPPIIKRFELEQIDKKLEYIKNDEYYADDYLYLLKSDIGHFTDLAEKAEFVLGNLDIYHNKKMKYAERKWHHEQLLKELFTEKELRKIHMVDCYKDEENGRKYKNCIAVEGVKGTDVYMFSIEENKYCKMSIQEFANEVLKGLKCLEKIPGLKNIVKQQKEKEHEK